jgi:hypothetical protein
VILGQEKWNKLAGNRPGYALLKCGTWAENRAVQLHNFYPMSESAFDKKKLIEKPNPFATEIKETINELIVSPDMRDFYENKIYSVYKKYLSSINGSKETESNIHRL